jgi:hypothetical protein
MKKAKKTKVPQQRTELDRIAGQLRTILRRETTDVILAGKLLIESREHLNHGEWQPWLAEHFDLNLRTAQNYVAAAEYVARQIGNVADFSNLSPTVLYELAAGHYYNKEEEAEILAATRKGRVDQDAAYAICEKLAPPDDDDADDGDDREADGEGDKDAEEAPPDPEIEAILDGPPPDVLPPAPITPPDFTLRAFDQAVNTLRTLITKSAERFAATVHTTDDLESVESFIRAVADRAREARPVPTGERAR